MTEIEYIDQLEVKFDLDAESVAKEFVEFLRENEIEFGDNRSKLKSATGVAFEAAQNFTWPALIWIALHNPKTRKIISEWIQKGGTKMFGSSIKMKIDTSGGAEIEVRSVEELTKAMKSLIDFNHARSEDRIKEQRVTEASDNPSEQPS